MRREHVFRTHVLAVKTLIFGDNGATGAAGSLALGPVEEEFTTGEGLVPMEKTVLDLVQKKRAATKKHVGLYHRYRIVMCATLDFVDRDVLEELVFLIVTILAVRHHSNVYHRYRIVICTTLDFVDRDVLEDFVFLIVTILAVRHHSNVYEYVIVNTIYNCISYNTAVSRCNEMKTKISNLTSLVQITFILT